MTRRNKSNNWILIIGVILNLFAASLVVGQKAQQPEDLQKLIEEALENNPQIKVFGRAVQANQAAIPQASSLPDPQLNFNLLNIPVDTYDLNQEAMSGKQLSVVQKIPFPGKLGLQEDIARDEVEASNQAYTEIKNRTIQNVKLAYYGLYYIDKAIETTERNQRLLEEFVEVAETKYRVGKGLQQDVLKAQVELSKMTDKLITWKQMRKTAVARLNNLLNRPAQTKIATIKIPAFEPKKLNRDELEQKALGHRALLEMWQTRQKQSQKKVNLAKKDYWPDFALSLSYTQREVLKNGMGGVDFLSGGISLNVPLYFWRKQSKKVEERSFLKAQTDEMYSNIRSQILFELESTWVDLYKNAELEDLYRTGIVPQASQSLQSAMSGYQTDKVDFLTLVNNQLTLFNMELEYERIVSNYYKNLAELEFIVGSPLVNVQ